MKQQYVPAGIDSDTAQPLYISFDKSNLEILRRKFQRDQV